MPLYPLQIKPGIDKEKPSLTSEPAWRDCNFVRFKNGFPEKMGGWQQSMFGLNALAGVARSIHKWRLNSGEIATAIGTHEKLYVIYADALYDITPIRETQALSNPFDTVLDSTTITVNDTAHGSNNGDYVTFSGATSTSFVDSEVNANHKITYIDANTYTFEVATAATATSNGTGGASVTAEYEIPVGPIGATAAYGFGTGAWGIEEWGDARSTSGSTINLRYWSLDHFGEDLVATHEAGRIYTWDASASGNTRATLISNSPDHNETIVVTNPDRHLVAFASTQSVGADQDFMLIRWADQETLTDWTSTATNTAGFQLLSGGSKILAVTRSQNSTLLWTDTSLYKMEHIGPPTTFGFFEIGTNCGAIGKQSVVAHNSLNYWMGTDDFFLYDGVVKPIPCSLHRHIFKDINRVQGDKVVAGVIAEFHEIIWFYPSAQSSENDSYVIYNYQERIWYYGTLERTAWLDSALTDLPQGIDSNGTIFNHETTMNNNGSAITAYIESSDMDIQEGDRFYFIRRLLPDMEIESGTVDYVIKTRRYPHSTQVTDTTLPVSSTTEKLDTRIRTRQLALRLESDAVDDEWRMGLSRIDIRPDGRR